MLTSSAAISALIIDSQCEWLYQQFSTPVSIYCSQAPAIFDESWTSLPKVIWEEDRVVALLHTYAVKSPIPIGYNGAPQIRSQKYPFPWSDPKPHYLPHP